MSAAAGTTALPAKDNPRNKLLCTLSPRDYTAISAQLKPITLELRQRMEVRGRPISHVCFVEEGIVSVVTADQKRKALEVGFIGPEGMTGLPVVLGADRTQHEVFVQVAGRGLRIEADQLRRLMKESPTLSAVLLRYAHVFMLQVSSTAKANGLGKLEERLARWLLMAQDRLETPELPLTHEFLSMMLGVHRPGVTIALSSLQRQGLIDVRRGAIAVVDRRGLEAVADKFYGMPEAEYERLLSAD